MTSPGLRNMENIRRSPCCARILNLLDLTPAAQAQAGESFEPFFSNPVLNRAIIIKHRLRANELPIFNGARTVGTKLFIPFNHDNLRDGGQYIFINEQGAERIYRAHFGLEAAARDPAAIAHRDIRALELLDQLPSLDPFILRERLRMDAIFPHDAYFQLSPAEYQARRAFIENEFAPLLQLAFGDQAGNPELYRGFVAKIWDARDEQSMMPLFQTLHINPAEVAEILFSWKGFIYYKSELRDLEDKFFEFMKEFVALRVRGLRLGAEHAAMQQERERIAIALAAELTTIKTLISAYDAAYLDGLIAKSDPAIFKSFLIAAPANFRQLGAAIAALRHAVSFWNFRFANKRLLTCGAEEFTDILFDFANGLPDG